MLLNASQQEAIKTVEVLKHSPFNIRLSLKNFDDRPKIVNEKNDSNKEMGAFKRVFDAINQEETNSGNANGVVLTDMYDDNLNEIKNYI